MDAEEALDLVLNGSDGDMSLSDLDSEGSFLSSEVEERIDAEQAASNDEEDDADGLEGADLSGRSYDEAPSFESDEGSLDECQGRPRGHSRERGRESGRGRGRGISICDGAGRGSSRGQQCGTGAGVRGRYRGRSRARGRGRGARSRGGCGGFTMFAGEGENDDAPPAKTWDDVDEHDVETFQFVPNHHPGLHLPAGFQPT